MIWGLKRVRKVHSCSLVRDSLVPQALSEPQVGNGVRTNQYLECVQPIGQLTQLSTDRPRTQVPTYCLRGVFKDRKGICTCTDRRVKDDDFVIGKRHRLTESSL